MESALPTASAASSADSAVRFGDSSPFPYGFDFLDAIRAVIDCCVGLLSAQETIEHANKHVQEAEQRVRQDRAGFDLMLSEFEQVGTRFLGVGTGLRDAAAHVIGAAQARVERDHEQLGRELAAETAGAHRVIDEACAGAYELIETLFLKHVPPDSDIGWRLRTDDEGYDGRVILKTKFGVEAVFGIACPDAHAFGHPRRVSDFAPGTNVRMPRTGGRRSGELRAVGLDKLFISEAAFDPERVALVLRARPHGGSGYRIEVHSANEQVFVQLLDEGGQPAGEVLGIDAGDRAPLVALSSEALDRSFDLVLRRQLMVSAAIDGQSLRERFQPREVCRRLVAVYAPVVNQIALRTGPPGELMLRRDLENGRRETVFIKRAELREKLVYLPRPAQRLFDPFGI